jgi:hypothetical protein
LFLTLQNGKAIFNAAIQPEIYALPTPNVHPQTTGQTAIFYREYYTNGVIYCQEKEFNTGNSKFDHQPHQWCRKRRLTRTSRSIFMVFFMFVMVRAVRG